MIRFIRPALAVLLLAACESQPAPEAEPPAPMAPPRAQTLADTLMVEGMPQPTTATLLSTPPGTPMPFSTYVPEGIATDFEGAADTVAVRFAAAFSPESDPNAYMHVRFYVPGTTVADARETLNAFLVGRQPDDDPVGDQPRDQPYEVMDTPPAWADEGYSIMYVGEGNVYYSAVLILASRGGRVFHVLTHYPAEYGDGLGPRFDFILRHWRWDDTGDMLVQ
ncbi:MAG TPA: hypothetical protein VK929_07495 [Longimicrobiales bacterium]|nr:hypothetical protein [Longimicrobiales bacterium]